MDEPSREAKLSRSMEKEGSTGKLTKAVLFLLFILLLILIALTSLLLHYYLAVSKEVSHLKKENAIQDIKAINKTLNSICGSCPSGWRPIGLYCYYFSTESLSWANATDECIRKGSTLLFIKEKEESDALRPHLVNGRYWMGLRSDKDPENWIWLDGSPLSYSHAQHDVQVTQSHTVIVLAPSSKGQLLTVGRPFYLGMTLQERLLLLTMVTLHSARSKTHPATRGTRLLPCANQRRTQVNAIGGGNIVLIPNYAK
ncbi:uncharacterized protein LOC142204476 [Leptodactylus fuscus]|uniref:uncharacterized protein LOC142204476 n=1 Tax=Leptodactylus fuscus TaxID=238119 RepID=UPI003F4EE618